MADVKNEAVESWEDLLAVEDADFAQVVIGNRTIRLASVSSDVMLDWLKGQDDKEIAETNVFRLIALSLVNSTGERIGKLDEILKLRTKNPKTLSKLRRAALELNGLREVETKNEPGGPESDASPSALPSPSAE